MKVSRP